MAKEIERKFLVNDDSYMESATKCRHIEQGYLSRQIESTVRIRITDEKAYITIKGKTSGIERDEWEYEIPAKDAREMLDRCAEGNVIRKTRYYVPFDGLIWEVDRFEGVHEGLTVAEVELPASDHRIQFPPFVGEEVSGDPRYYNSNL